MSKNKKFIALVNFQNMYFVLKLLPISDCPYHNELVRNTHRFSTNFIFLSSVLVQLFTIQLLGSPPYSGTIFVDPDILTEDDPTSFQGLEDAGQASRTMYDRRSGWVSENAFLFNASFSDLPDVEIQVNPEFGNVDAARLEAEKYAPVIGRLPKCLREDVETVWIHKGVYGFGGGNNNLLIHTGQADEYVASGILEETFIHEACHTSLDAEHAFAEEWLAAQIADDAFISTYARDNPTREDIAESFLLYYALRYRAERISESVAEVIQETMPNRIAYFDSLDLGLEDLGDDFWNGALDLGNNWRWLDWFGTYYQESSNLLYLFDIGWLYSQATSSTSIWFWHEELGWLWTSRSVFPCLYLHSASSWIYWHMDSGRYLRYYYDLSSGGWVEL